MPRRYLKHQSKILTIPNGYDLDDFTQIEKTKEDCFTIAYLGNLYMYRQRDRELLLRAISELIREGHLKPNAIRLRFVGVSGDKAETSMRALVGRYDLGTVVDVIPWVPRQQALEIMVRSHVLLVLAENQPLQIPGKVYDYLAAGSTILALTGEGATADLAHDSDRIIPVAPNDHETLKKTLRRLYLEHREMRRPLPSGPVAPLPPAKYNRRNLAEHLAALLNAACPRP